MKHIIAFLIVAMCLLTPRMAAQESSWEPMNRGLQHLLLYTLELHPDFSDRMYTGTDYGNFYRTDDGAFNWTLSRDGIPPDYNRELVTALYLDPVHPDDMFCGFGGRQSTKNLFRSTDGGAKWNVVPTPESWKNGGVLHIHRTGGSRPVLFCGLGWYNGIWRSEDDGVTWTQKLASYGVQVLRSSPKYSGLLFAGVSGKGPLFRSGDGGVTWTLIDASVFQGDDLTGGRSLAFSADGETVYAGITGKGCGLYRSTDYGAHWTKLNAVPEISEISIHPEKPEVLYISAIGSGVHRSLDGGQTWVQLTEGLPTKTVMRVRVAKGYPVRVFAVTLNYGIYRMVDEELSEELFRSEVRRETPGYRSGQPKSVSRK